MGWKPESRPRLRNLEAFRLPEQEGNGIVVRDPCGLSDTVLTLSEAAALIMTMLDGQNTCEEIRDKFCESVGQPIPTATLQSMLERLEQAHFLDGPAFESYYSSLESEYRSKAVRGTPKGSALEALRGSGGALFDEVLAEVDAVELSAPAAGIVAPHLDFARGRPCYAGAYAALLGRPIPGRVVILGTNHFGRSTSVVATASDFATPLGLTRTDAAFLEQLEARCGNLRTYEFDHAREHSVELQLAWLQHLFGPDEFRVLAFLCPDPCGPTGTAPHDGRGVDLREFAATLGDLTANDRRDTLIVAGADLSHVGAAFGDDGALADAVQEAKRCDQRALDQLVRNGPAGWVRCIAENDNPTRICSAGSIFALATALPNAKATVLAYHQAVDEPSQTGVTCAALVFA